MNATEIANNDRIKKLAGGLNLESLADSFVEYKGFANDEGITDENGVVRYVMDILQENASFDDLMGDHRRAEEVLNELFRAMYQLDQQDQAGADADA